MSGAYVTGDAGAPAPGDAPAIVLVAALDANGAIGRENALLWHLPDDLRRFKALTLGRPVLMGRRTAESIGRALPGRRNLVLTRSGRAPFEGMTPVASLDEARALTRAEGAAELMVIGGGEVYALALPHAARLHLTHVDARVDAADAWFPPLPPGAWQVTRREPHPIDARHPVGFEYVDYARR